MNNSQSLDTANGLAYLHERDICHGDVKEASFPRSPDAKLARLIKAFHCRQMF